MGQNNTKDDWLAYSSQGFFQQQIEFYKWRSNTQINSHICRVNFQLQESIQDRQKLRLFLQNRFKEGQYISLSQMLKLAQAKNSKTKDELMNFENYVFTLQEFQQRLTLTQTLHSLYILFSGYEALYAKVGKFRVKLIYVFLTGQGQIRCWINRDYKSNDVCQDCLQPQQNCAILNSEMAIIKKIVELGQKLVNNHTEYLHFSRQFKSYMERDILHNWNFSNARKLINSYAYTYKLNLPNNLKEQVKRRIEFISTAPISVNYYSQIQSANSSFNNSKNYFQSTGDVFVRKQQIASNPTSSRKQNQPRPISLSDYSGKKSQDISKNIYKLHSKNFSSIDSKNFNEREKQYQSPKMSRSEPVTNQNKEYFRAKKQFIFQQQSQVQEAPIKMRRQPQFAVIGQSPDTKNTPMLNPYCITQQQNDLSNIFAKGEEQSKTKNKQNFNNSVLKQNQVAKQKKKLEKKAVAVSKYISFYQENKQGNNAISGCSVWKDLIQQYNSVQKVNISPSPSDSNMNKNPQVLEEQFSKQTTQPRIQNSKITNSNVECPINRVAFQNFQSKSSEVMPFRAKNQHMKTWQKNYIGNNSQQRMVYTIKTLNKLVNNSEVSLHESNGSFSEVNQSNCSQYKGVLAKMGRSIDMANLPSNKNVQTIKKKPTASSQLNRSIYN